MDVFSLFFFVASLVSPVLIGLVLLAVHSRRHGAAEVFCRRLTITLAVYLPLYLARQILMPRALEFLLRMTKTPPLAFALTNNLASLFLSVLLWLGLAWSVMGLPVRSYPEPNQTNS